MTHPTHALALSCLLAVSVSGCLKQPRVVQATTPVPVAVVPVLDSYEEPVVLGVDDLTRDLVSEAVEARNLMPQVVSVEPLLGAYADVRTTERRLELAAAQAGTAPLVLLIETDARFGAQVNGRYRWTVTAEISLAPTDALGEAVHVTERVPVHLVYYHQKEQAAVQEAAPVIARHAGRLLDEWIGLSEP